MSADVVSTFNNFDVDHSGYIDAKELRGALSALGLNANAKETTTVLQRYNSRSTQALDLAEFSQLVSDVQQWSSGEGAIERVVQDTFAQYDADNNGSIDAKELQLALAQLGLPANARETVVILEKYDADSNMVLTLSEFNRLVQDARCFQEAQSKVVDRTSTADASVPEEVRRVFQTFDRDRSGDMGAADLGAALEAMAVMSKTLIEAASLLKIYDSSSCARLSLQDFALLVKEVKEHRFGTAAVMQPILRQHDVAVLFSKHAKSVDELFAVYQPQVGVGAVVGVGWVWVWGVGSEGGARLKRMA